MVTAFSPSDTVTLRPGIKAPVKETLLTPRFYTTDFEEIANMVLDLQDDEIAAALDELRADYNRHHFIRDDSFDGSIDHIDEKTRAAFIDFLERSCTSEFSGFLLFKELSRKLKGRSPVLAEAFGLLARDEARHAGFINKAMVDFGLSLDLGYLTKKRTYTFFPPEWVIYSVYLSEKIGYWRYILVFRHLEKHPEHNLYPLFNYFENWCQDENRHGDFFKALLRSQPKMWDTWQGRLWGRFFLLTVFATHTITVFERADFYEAIGMDVQQYNIDVIRNTNETSAKAFAEIMDVDHPQFFALLDKCSEANETMAEISMGDRPPIAKFLLKLPSILTIIWCLIRLYFFKPIDAESTRCEVH